LADEESETVRLKSFLLFGLTLALSSTVARASLSLVLTPSVQACARSNEVFFTGVLSNTDPTNDLYLNDIQFITDGNFSSDSNAFFANVPGILSAGQTYSDVVFGVTMNPTTPAGDYFGAVSILGGSNIFAASNLATQPFQISTIDVSISANVADAYKFGAQPGSFVVTCVGGSDLSLVVNYVIGGTASNGVNYSSITNSVTSADSAPSTIAVIPLDDGVVEGDKTVVLTLSNSTAYNLATPTSATVTIHDTPFNAWRLANFGANANNNAISGDLADPDGDGLVNLLEYALDLNPNVPGASGLPTPQRDPTCGCLTLTYTKVLAAVDLTYTPEAASNPGGPWNTNGITQMVITSNAVTQTVRASDAANPFATSTNRFMHLKVTRQP
jgi:hypothetical protein